jgi:hypothetical protein
VRHHQQAHGDPETSTISHALRRHEPPCRSSRNHQNRLISRASCQQCEKCTLVARIYRRSQGKSALTAVAPAFVNRTVTPRRAKNGELRSREYLTGQEVEGLMAAARQNGHGHRDATMILVLPARPSCVRTCWPAVRAGRLPPGCSARP